MNQDKYVFAQLTAFLNRTQFNNFVRKYDGNCYVKQFTCWNQLLAMMFGQLSNRESLHDLIVAFEAHRAKSRGGCPTRYAIETLNLWSLQILSISLTDKTHLRDLFNKTNFNDVKELDCPLLEGVFD